MKGQEGYLVGLGFIIAGVIALATTNYFMGASGSNLRIKQDMPKAVYSNEKIKTLLDQERQYQLDKALLITGMESGNLYSSSCGSIEVKDHFPFIPVDEIKYWKVNEKQCIPTEEEISKYVNNFLMKDVAIKPSSIIGKEIDSYFDVELHNEHGVYYGSISEPYLINSYNVACRLIRTEMYGTFYSIYQCNLSNGNKVVTLNEGEAKVLETEPIEKTIKLEKVDGFGSKAIAHFSWPDMIFYLPKEEKFEVEEFKIGDIPKFGEIVYKFIPGERVAKEKEVRTSERFPSETSSILSSEAKNDYFTILYQLSKEFAIGSYVSSGIKYNGWMEAELDNEIRNKLEAVMMPTLKVFVKENGEEKVIPMHDWKTRLIWSLSLVGTKYNYSYLDKLSEKCLIYKDNLEIKEIIDNCNCKDYCKDDKECLDNCVTIYNCTSDECNNITKEAIKSETKRIFEQISPAKLEGLTLTPWNIKIKEVNVSVKNLCNDEEIKVNIKNKEEYKKSGYNYEVLSIPLQMLFAEKSKVTLKPEKASLACLYDRENANKPGAICLDNDEFGCYYSEIVANSEDLKNYYKETETCKIYGDKDECAKNEAIKIAHLTCTTNNYCCPIGWEDSIREYKCCRLVKSETKEETFKELYDGVEMEVKKKVTREYYKCVLSNGTVIDKELVKIKEKDTNGKTGYIYGKPDMIIR